jgi:hypothetical protein
LPDHQCEAVIREYVHASYNILCHVLLAQRLCRDADARPDRDNNPSRLAYRGYCSTGASRQAAGQSAGPTPKPSPGGTAEARAIHAQDRRTISAKQTEQITEDELTEHQSVDTFVSLEDGQPGKPGEFEVEMKWGWEMISTRKGPLKEHPHNTFGFEGEIEYTLQGNEFLNNTQLQLAVPLELGNGRVDGNGDIILGWQQRWVKEADMVPTLATLAQIRVPSGDQSSGVDGTLTAIIAKELGPGTAFFNAFGKSANGNNFEDVRYFQWGFRAGYKWRLSDQFAIVGDYAYQSSEERGHGDLNILEFGGEYRVTDNLTIGPGLQIGLDDNEETPDVGAGIQLKYSF